MFYSPFILSYQPGTVYMEGLPPYLLAYPGYGKLVYIRVSFWHRLCKKIIMLRRLLPVFGRLTDVPESGKPEVVITQERDTRQRERPFGLIGKETEPGSSYGKTES
jgi:hypothetical protein